MIGLNGHGKSTLLNIIKGDLWPEDGQVHVREDKTLEAVNQHISFTQGSVRAEACQGLLGNDKGQEWLAAKMLYGLGFSEAEQHLPPQQFSGGYQVRINLAKALLSRPDILLLDEPTNFLDITSLRWLERFFQNWKGTFILVTHDQTFMEGVVTHTMAIHRQGIKKAEGGPSKLRKQIAHEEQIHKRTRQNQEKKDAKTHKFISEFRSGARSAGLVQSRIKMLDKVKKLPKLPPIKPVHFSFQASPFEADVVIRANSLSFGYDAEDLIRDLDLTIYPGDRVGIVGPNGRGKSTLLDLIARKKEPQTGTIKHNADAQIGHFSQMNVPQQDKEKTVFEVLRSITRMATDEDIHKLCSSLMFEGDKRHRHLKVLSGGERSRLALGKLMLVPHNILLLDEPTNHLDMESCTALANGLQDYDGAIVCVTHDEALLRSFADRLIVFDDGKVTHFRGSYDQFLKQVGWNEPAPMHALAVQKKKSTTNNYVLQRQLKKKLRPFLKRIEETENEIMALEEKMKQLETEMQEAQKKGQVLKIGDVSIAIADTHNEIERLFVQLEQQQVEIEAETKAITKHVEKED